MDILYIVAILVILSLSILAVLAPWFDDNSLQRVAFSFTSIGCAGELYSLFIREVSSTNSRTLIIIGIAVALCGSMLKAFIHRKGGPRGTSQHSHQ